MKQFTWLTILAGAASAYFGIYDRQSSIALELVELETSLGTPLWMICGVAAALSIGLQIVQSALTPAPKSRRQNFDRKRTHQPDPAHEATGGTWIESAISSAKMIPFPSGARLTHNNHGTVPFDLHLEHAPPERCRRAVTLLAEWVGTIPLPPRLRIHFKNCPEGGSPRHHQVAGALATVMPRSGFKVTSGLDSVDIMFLHPDPRWSSDDGST